MILLEIGSSSEDVFHTLMQQIKEKGKMIGNGINKIN